MLRPSGRKIVALCLPFPPKMQPKSRKQPLHRPLSSPPWKLDIGHWLLDIEPPKPFFAPQKPIFSPFCPQKAPNSPKTGKPTTDEHGWTRIFRSQALKFVKFARFVVPAPGLAVGVDFRPHFRVFRDFRSLCRPKTENQPRIHTDGHGFQVPALKFVKFEPFVVPARIPAAFRPPPSPDPHGFACRTKPWRSLAPWVNQVRSKNSLAGKHEIGRKTGNITPPLLFSCQISCFPAENALSRPFSPPNAHFQPIFDP